MANVIEIVIRSKDEASGVIEGVGDSLAGMGKKIIAAAGGIAAALGLAKLTQAAWRYGSAATLTAARSSELAAVLDLLGARAGWTAEQIDGNVKAMMDLGIRSDVSLGLLAQFARYQLDAADATGIARVAQDAAVLSMKDSSEALDQIMHGILTQNSMVLRNAGLNVIASRAMDTYAASLGKTTQQLTETERIQAMMNAVMEEGTRIAGAYDTAMEEPGKRMRSLARHFFEIKDTIGQAFLPAFGNAISVLEGYAKWVRAAVEEGGFLQPALLRIGAAADIVSGKFAEMTQSALVAGQGVYEGLSGRLSATANAALGWGINIVTQLASGIIQGAAAALTAAMNYVASMLSWFLSPGSPPRVAPDIDKWGQAAMNEYLTGFTTASFDILEGIQRPLSNILSTLVTSGAMVAEDAAALFHAIGADLTHAVSEFQQDGTLLESLLSRLGEVGGEFGAQLVELARRQFSTAAATDRLRQATTALTQAQEGHADAQSDVARLTDEYNSMLIEGASYEELAAKRAEKADAERRQEQTKGALKAAEVEKDAAEEQLDLERERLDLQGRLIDQMELLARTQADMVAAALPGMGGGGGGGGGAGPKLPAGGGGGLELPELPSFAGAGGGITRGLNEAFEEAKRQVSETWATLFAPVRTAWEEDVKPALEMLAAAWDNLWAQITGVYERYIVPFAEGVGELIPAETRDAILETAGKIAGVLLAFGGSALVAKLAVAGLALVLGALTTPIGLVVAAVIGLAVIWETNFLGIRKALENAWPVIEGIFASISDWVTGTLIPTIQKLYAKWVDEVWPTIQTVTQNVWTVIEGIFQEIGRWINDNLGPWVEYLREVWADTVWPAIQTALETAWGVIEPIFNDIKEWLGETLPPIVEGIQSSFETAMSAIDSAIQPVKTAIDNLMSAAETFWNWISSRTFKFNISIPDLPDWATPGSPLPIHTAWKDFAAEMKRMEIAPRFNLDGAAVAASGTGGGTNTTHLYIERVVIENVRDAPDLLRQLQEMVI